jgi:hypothetical protein
MFNIGDRVKAKVITGVATESYLGTIVDVDEVAESISGYVRTGRVGVKLDGNPLSVAVPYFWHENVTKVEHE